MRYVNTIPCDNIVSVVKKVVIVHCGKYNNINTVYVVCLTMWSFES